MGDRAVFSHADAIRTALHAVRRRWGRFLGLACLLILVPGVLMNAVVNALWGPGSDAMSARLLESATMALSFALVEAVVAHDMLSDRDQRASSFGDTLALLWKLLPRLFGLMLVRAIFISLALVALIVPGIIVYLNWSVAVPALVHGQGKVALSLSRSRDLTRNSRWAILGLLAPLIFAGFAAGWLFPATMTLAPLAFGLGYVVIFSAVIAAIYMELLRVTPPSAVSRTAGGPLPGSP